jgi:DNA-binding CsgD family transcriptional regulator
MYQALLNRNIYLTNRECEVLSLWLSAETAKESGRWLGISSRTVEYHREKIRRKFEVASFFELKKTVQNLGLDEEFFLQGIRIVRECRNGF